MQYTRGNKRPTKEIKRLELNFLRQKNLPLLGRFLTIIACHTDTDVKFNSVVNNLKFLNFAGNQIAIVNSSDCPLNEKLKEFITTRYPDIQYVTYPNNSELDCGKWMRYLKDYYRGQIYNYIIFTNDSYFLHNSINHFYNGAVESMKDLYGFTSSTQIHYHYQSFLFAIQTSMIRKLINHYNRVKNKLTDYMSVVGNIELQLFKVFNPSCGCCLDLGRIPGNRGRNVFFNNDSLYLSLRESGIVPMTKIKRIHYDKQMQERNNFFKTMPSNSIKEEIKTTIIPDNEDKFSRFSNAPMVSVGIGQNIGGGKLPVSLTGLLTDRKLNRF